MAETENEVQARQSDLTTLAEGMEAGSRTRALEKILSQHNRMGEDIDVLSRTVARQSETITGLERRLAALEAKPPISEPAKSTDENKTGVSGESAKRAETRRRRGWPPF